MNELSLGPLSLAISKRYQQLIVRTQQMPPLGSRPLTVAGRVSGWVTAKATRVVSGLPGVHIEPEAVHITTASAQRWSLNRVLEHVAQKLQEAGCLKTWRNELLDVVGEGRRLACIERAAVRPLGLLTRAVHLNAWTPDGKLWIALRSATKATDPGLWDTLVGGLACAGESLDQSLLRESNEEAGLEAASLATRSDLHIILRMHRRLPEGYQVEDVLVSECVLDESMQLKNLDGEVSEIKAVSIDDAWTLAKEGKFTFEAELVVLDSLIRRFSKK